MNKFLIYVLLILLYFGLSGTLTIQDNGVSVINNENNYSQIIQGSPVSVLLVDYFTAGFIIKTYFHKYKVIYGFKRPVVFTLRVSKMFYEKNIDNLGMSLFRRSEHKNKEEVVPMPPGFLFVGDLAYGRWRYQNSGVKIWKFHRAYKNFPIMFKWLDYQPTFDEFEKAQISLEERSPFYGANQQFGTKGEISKQGYSPFFSKKQKNNFSITYFLKNFFRLSL